MTQIAQVLNLHPRSSAFISVPKYFMLTSAQIQPLATLALSAVQREYPNAPQHVVMHAQDVALPRTLHPAFYGSFDWHSAVHGHWLLVWVLRHFPDLSIADEIRHVLNAHFTAENLQTEADYFQQPGRAGFERPYGWAWALKLTLELAQLKDAGGQNWHANIQPLAQALESLYLRWLPKQTYPLRSGTHGNTAFGLSFALDYTDAHGHTELSTLIHQQSRAYFLADKDYPAAWEPSGSDFFSACLVEADLMRRVLPADELVTWLTGFLPQLPPSLSTPATVSDRGDSQLVHLDGLNLSRAYCLFNLAQALPAEDARRATFRAIAQTHLETGLAHLLSGDFTGEHWLATFALLALEAKGT